MRGAKNHHEMHALLQQLSKDLLPPLQRPKDLLPLLWLLQLLPQLQQPFLLLPVPQPLQLPFLH